MKQDKGLSEEAVYMTGREEEGAREGCSLGTHIMCSMAEEGGGDGWDGEQVEERGGL